MQGLSQMFWLTALGCFVEHGKENTIEVLRCVVWVNIKYMHTKPPTAITVHNLQSPPLSLSLWFRFGREAGKAISPYGQVDSDWVQNQLVVGYNGQV